MAVRGDSMAGGRKKILVVDDEVKIVEVVKSYLENSGYDVCEAYDGKKALELFDKIEPSLVILDLMIPDISGEEICKALRRKSRVPIIMLTAKVEEKNVLNGFNIGADDYVTKPFSPRQLVARVAALLRRTEDDVVPLADILSFNEDELIVDNIKHEVKKNHNIVNLTPTEYKILMAMVKYPKKAFTREELVYMALGDEYEGFDRVIDTHIKNLRQKLEFNPKEPKYILTIHGIGYRFGGE
jgi:DNA-binding response OmpR family regulator